jgi:hypothetical protein
LEEVKKMAVRPRKIVTTEYYYDSDSDYESELDFDYDPARDSESDTELDVESDEEEVSDSEDGTDYESETEPESDSEELDEPKPYYGKGFRVYFDSTADKKFFMQAFGFLDA